MSDSDDNVCNGDNSDKKSENIEFIDTEYDETLDIPDTISVIQIADIPIKIDGCEKVTPAERLIPFSVVHNPAVKFSSFHRNVFIPGVDISVQITGHERSVTTHLLNPNLYTIQFRHGEYTWTVKKRYKHFQHLHQQLRLFRASLNIPFPTKSHKERRISFKQNAEQANGGRKSALPRFPSKPEALVNVDQIGDRMKQLEDYLENLLCIVVYRNHEETLKFMEVSHLSFVKELGVKGKEGLIQKRTGSTQPGQAGCNFFGFLQSTCCVRLNYLCNDVICGKWCKRWFFIKDTYFGYVNPKTGQVKCVALLDQGFEVSSGMYSAGTHRGIQLMTLTRQLYIKCWTKRKSREWIQYLKDICENEARDFTQTNPHNSFVPVRPNTPATWFVDGSSYMSTVADALEGATQEIFITDWWLSPEIYLKRKVLDTEYWRLDKILQRKAKQGVKVFVLLYKEVEMALGINSYYSKVTLMNGCPNIKILRHPDHAKVGVFMWAHHEKMVIVDQSIAFIGGIDLCYGRWDDHVHRLTDLGSVTFCSSGSTCKKKTSSTPTDNTFFPPKKLPPSFLPDPDLIASTAPELPTINFQPITEEPPSPSEPITEGAAWTEPMTNRESLPQLQPGDRLLIMQPIRENMKLNTPEFERKPNVFNRIKESGKEVIQMFYSSEEEEKKEENTKVKLVNENSIDGLDGLGKLWLGKDYANFIVKDFENLDAPYVDLVDRKSTPRMPWHDIAVLVQGKAAKDAARHFIQRWNSTKLEKTHFNNTYPYLLPKSYKTNAPIKNFNLETSNVSCQIIRSVSCWSAGFLDPDFHEQSIHEAYVDSINRAEHYIYIENQFFITLGSGNGLVHNQIGDALYHRIIKAHREKATFRVYVVMPLLPGFEGEIGSKTGTSLHIITYWNYASINRGKHSILARLKAQGIEDPSQYITFYALRTHNVLDQEPVTELIYVHSKLLIVDDRLVICGSANINDRSLIGKRDSEVAVIIKDEEFIQGVMNSSSYPCGKFASSLRKQLFSEHLGLLTTNYSSISIEDPVSDAFYQDIWYQIAKDNTEYYEKVFHCIPSDKVETFEELKKYQEEPPLYHTEISRATNMLENIQGHLVLLPLNFLKNENLQPPDTSMEGMMPTSLWT